MPGNSREMITMAERRFPVRIRIGVPHGGLGQRHSQMTIWLDENCGADGWAMAPSGMRGVLNDAISVYFLDATIAGAFVARWCAGYRVETADGVFHIRAMSRHRGSVRDYIGRLERDPGQDAPQHRKRTGVLPISCA